MCKALIIGAGGVGTVVAQKIAANPIFSDVMLASRTKAKCDAIAAAIGGDRVKTAQVDADNVAETAELADEDPALFKLHDAHRIGVLLHIHPAGADGDAAQRAGVVRR